MEDSSPPMLSLFGDALACQSAEEQAAFLDRACGANKDLRAKLESLLRAHRESGDFLLGRPAAQPLHATCATSEAERPGATVGPYKLLEQIGEGGMGAVYMADQQVPVRRRVALKIIKPGMDTRRVIARFEAERQALALMDHPNIARVLDAGETASGRPYFVMELVRGVPINEYCDQHSLSIPERLKLFDLVCHAVQHAHQKGIIHRDIKPTNVLVTLHDGRPVPKVIDFGIAKATGQQLTEKTLFTEFHQLIGTPLYMSPEQAELSGLDIDTRSDIYSLGVLLYELLTGTTPLERGRLKEAAYDEVRRIIREEDPPKPSTRASSLEHSQPSLAALRSTEPRKLCQLLQGDLDWIVMKALEKDRTRRYATAAGLAADIQRHLSDQPVEACPPSAAYRFRKFARRNRVALVTVSVVLVALAAGTLVSSWQAIRATQAEGLADARLRTEATARAAEARQRDLAEEQRKEAEKQREAAEANFQKVRQAVDEYFTLISESTLFDVPGLNALRLELLERAIRFYQELLDQRGADAQLLGELATAHLRTAQVYREVNRTNDAVAAIGYGVDLVERLRREYPGAVDDIRRVSGFWKGSRLVGPNVALPKDPAATEQTLRRFLALWETLSREHPAVPGFRSDLAAVYATFADWQSSSGHGAEGLETSQKAIAMMEQLVREYPHVAEYRAGLASELASQAYKLAVAGRPAEEGVAPHERALALREQLGTEFPEVPQYRMDLAASLDRRAARLEAAGEHQEALATYRRALGIAESLIEEYPTAQPILYQLCMVHLNWAGLLMRAEKNTTEAQHHFQQAVAISYRLSDESPRFFGHVNELLLASIDLVALLNSAGRADEALDVQRDVLVILQQALDAATRLSAASPNDLALRWELIGRPIHLARILRSTNRPAEVERELRRSLDALKKAAVDFSDTAEGSVAIAGFARDLGVWLNNENFLAEAEQAYLIGVKIFEHAPLKSGVPQEETLRLRHLFYAADAHRNLAHLSARLGKSKEVEVHFRKAVELSEGLPAAFFPANQGYLPYVGPNYISYADFLRDNNRPDDAVAVLRQGVDYFARLSAELPEDHALSQESVKLQKKYASLLQAANRPAEAEEAFRNALDTEIKAGQRAVDENRQLVQAFPDRTDHRVNLASLYRGLSDSLRAAGRSAEAAEAFSASCELYKKLDADFPDKTEFRNDLTRHYVLLAEGLLAQSKHAEAAGILRQAIQTFDELAAAHPAAPDYRRFRALFEARLARLRSLTGKADEADQAIHQAVDSHQRIIENFPEYNELGLVYLNLAILLTAAGQPEPAESAYAKGVELVGNKADVLNNFAWRFATAPEPRFRQPRWGVELARKATEVAPQVKTYFNALGVAQYRAGAWQDAVATLDQVVKETNGGTSFDFFFLAMAEWQLGNKEIAQTWYAQAVEWMEKHQPENYELCRFRTEAQELLGIGNGSTAPPAEPAPVNVATPMGS